jgi:hypothetical protein
MANAKIDATLAWSGASIVAVSLVVAGCSSLIGVPDVPQPAEAGEDAGGGVFDAQTSPEAGVGDAAEGNDAPTAADSGPAALDAGGG